MGKKYLVSLAKPDRRIKGMNIGGKFHKFGDSGHSFIMSDSGAAKEMNTEFGRARRGDIVVSEMPGYTGKSDIGHRYSFGPATRGTPCLTEGCIGFAFLGDYCVKHKKLAQEP